MKRLPIADCGLRIGAVVLAVLLACASGGYAQEGGPAGRPVPPPATNAEVTAGTVTEPRIFTPAQLALAAGTHGTSVNLTNLPNWSAGTDYAQAATVSHNGSSWFAQTDPTTGEEPGVASDWTLIAEKGDTGATGATGDTGAAGANGTNGAGYDATSSTSLAISAGSKVATITTGKAYAVGHVVRFVDAANSANWMQGPITAHNSGTGALTFTAAETNGSGTISSWNVGVGATLPATASFDQVNVTQMLAKADVLEAPYFAADAGANDTYTATLAPAITAYVTGARYRFKANTANTGAATLNLNGLGAITIKKAAGGLTTDLATNDIRAGQWVDVVYDGTNFQMQSTLGNAAAGSGDMQAATFDGDGNSAIDENNGGSNATTFAASYDAFSVHGADVASAGTINLDTATGNLVDVTGTTTITAITLANGRQRTVRFTGALTLTHGASLVLPGGLNITTAAGDFAIFRGYASSVVRCVTYVRASGLPVLMKETVTIAASDLATNITTGTAKAYWYPPWNCTVNAVRAYVQTVSTSGNPAFDINEGGVSMFSTTLTIDANELTSLTAATAAVISDSAWDAGDLITIDFDTAGTGTRGVQIQIDVTHAP